MSTAKIERVRRYWRRRCAKLEEQLDELRMANQRAFVRRVAETCPVSSVDGKDYVYVNGVRAVIK